MNAFSLIFTSICTPSPIFAHISFPCSAHNDQLSVRFDSNTINRSDCLIFTLADIYFCSQPPLKRKLASAATPNNGASGDQLPNEKIPSPKRAAKATTSTKPIYDPLTMRKPYPPQEDKTIHVVSWNVAGLRALLKKDPNALKLLADAQSPDIICLQEHKLQQGKHCEDAGASISQALGSDWDIHWNCSVDKKGYSGVAIISKTKPLSVEMGIGHSNHDGEGRVITAEFPDCFVVNVYVPNSGEGLKRLDYRVNQWDQAFSEHIKNLESRGKSVIVTGDLNCAAQEIDIHSPKTNLRSAGFTVEERESFAKRFLENGLVDVFRRLHPDVVGYTYWGYRFGLRAKNKGWRLDYFLVSEKHLDSVYDCYHLPHVMGSDHCPLGLVVML